MSRIAAAAVSLALLATLIPLTLPAQAATPPEPAVAADAVFEDVASDHSFAPAIAWLADQGITRGCNPPANTRFCPDDPVTRGQMAAFLGRTFFLRDTGPVFTDTEGSVFAEDISRLAQAGITKGCNPPDNTKFCPEDRVTRGQMAAFLTRAFSLPRADNQFTDDDGHVFEADIAALAQAGITKGCNPPDNTRFCPDDHVTRGQMAAFLHRAFGNPGLGQPGVNRVDPDRTIPVFGDEASVLTANPQGQSSITYEGWYLPDPGDHILLPPSNHFPTGYVGRIVAVSGSRLTITKGLLTDAIPQASFDLSDLKDQAAYASEDVLSVQGYKAPRTTLPVSWKASCDAGVSAEAKAQADVDVGLDGNISWDTFIDSQEDVEAYVYGQISASLTGALSADGSCQLTGTMTPKVLFSKPVFLGGWYPVWVSLSAGGDATGTLQADAELKVETSYVARGELGARRRAGNWGLHNTLTREFTPPTAALQASGSARVEVVPRFEMFLDGTAGLHMGAGPFVQFDSSLVADPWWTLDGGIHAEVGVMAGDWIGGRSETIVDKDLLTSRVAAAGGPIAAPLKITTKTLPPATVGEPYSVDLVRTGGLGPWYWTASGLPAGMELVYHSGELRGTPTEPGEYNVNVTVTDSRGQQKTKTLVMTVKLSVSVDLPLLTFAAGDNEQYNLPGYLLIEGGQPPYTYSVVGLPPGISLSSGGVLGGTLDLPPDEPDDIRTFEIGISDASDNRASFTVSIFLLNGGPVIYTATDAIHLFVSVPPGGDGHIRVRQTDRTFPNLEAAHDELMESDFVHEASCTPGVTPPTAFQSGDWWCSVAFTWDPGTVYDFFGWGGPSALGGMYWLERVCWLSPDFQWETIYAHSGTEC